MNSGLHGDFPRGLKPLILLAISGTAEAVPFQNSAAIRVFTESREAVPFQNLFMQPDAQRSLFMQPIQAQTEAQ
jgi:hypothetical protein